MKRPQSGFTLVEIAIVLVVIGLLLGGVLKGQELIASARVRSMADQQAGIQAAYYGFQDRYRAVPGDMPQTDADDAIQASVTTGGDGNGKIDDGTSKWEEVNAVWEHLSKSGFIKGSYPGDAAGISTSDTAPTNVFNGVLMLTRDDGYEGSATPERLLLYMGRNVPVDVARELDIKLDDGRPITGILRNAETSASPYGDLGQSAANCVSGSAGNEIWDISTNNIQDCHPAYLF